MPSLKQTLETIDAQDTTSQLKAYEEIAKTLVDECDLDKILVFLNHALSLTSNPEATNTAFTSLVSHVMQELDDDGAIQLTTKAIDLLKPRLASLRHTEYALRIMLKDVYRELQQYDKAAMVLERITEMRETFNMVHPNFSKDEAAYAKWYLDHFLEITIYWKTEGKIEAAEYYLAKKVHGMIRMLPHNDSHDPRSVFESHLKIRKLHLFATAGIYDMDKKFSRAAMKYFELYQLAVSMGDTPVKQCDEFLQSAMKCAVLTDASQPTRSRMLGTLHKDERAHVMPQAAVLEKMYMERLVKRAEVTAFEETLEPHQRMVGMDGLTSVMRSVIMHNILAASKIYHNIRISELATLVEIDAEQAESIAATLIAENKLNATIDQISGFLEFEAGAMVSKTLDTQIANLCASMNKVVYDGIKRRHPDLAILK